MNPIQTVTASEKIRIRFVPKNDLTDDPVNRMRCYNVMAALRQIGCDADLLRPGDPCEVLVILSLDFQRWLPEAARIQERGGVVIFDLSDNEFRRRAEISVAKFKGMRRYAANPWQVLQRVYFFFRRRKLDRGLSQMIRTANAVTTSTLQIQADLKTGKGQVHYIPDIIDFDRLAADKDHQSTRTPVVVWLGMPNNTIFLTEVAQTLARLQRKMALRVHLITHESTYQFYRDLNRRLAFSYQLVPWNLETVGTELRQADIAVAPLPAGVSKSVNKIATYWMAGLPVVVSPCVDYRALVSHGEDGFLAPTEDDWARYIGDLAADAGLRQRLADKGRSKVLGSFSPGAVAQAWKACCEQVYREQGQVPIPVGREL